MKLLASPGMLCKARWKLAVKISLQADVVENPSAERSKTHNITGSERMGLRAPIDFLTQMTNIMSAS
jgi:hypothetical protein